MLLTSILVILLADMLFIVVVALACIVSKSLVLSLEVAVLQVIRVDSARLASPFIKPRETRWVLFAA